MRYEGESNEFLTEGRASFVVKSCEDYIAKSGNEMLKVSLQVTDARNNKGTIYTYVYKKLSEFLYSMNLEHLYNPKGGNLNPQSVVGGSGECIIKTEKNASYGDKSAVEEFLPSRRDPNDQQQRSSRDTSPDDDVPF